MKTKTDIKFRGENVERVLIEKTITIKRPTNEVKILKVNYINKLLCEKNLKIKQYKKILNKKVIEEIVEDDKIEENTEYENKILSYRKVFSKFSMKKNFDYLILRYIINYKKENI
jgi:hypothetical protein